MIAKTFYDSQGRLRNIQTLEQTVDALWNLKRKSGTNPWPVITQIVEIFKAEYPQKWKSYLINVKDLRETRKEKKFASTVDPITGGTLRYTLDVPVKVHEMIRGMYSAQELNMNRYFWIEFAKRFPIFKVAEKL